MESVGQRREGKAGERSTTHRSGLVARILKAKRAKPTADTTTSEREIDERVYRLNGLTDPGSDTPRFVTAHASKTMNTIQELDAVALSCDLRDHGSMRGDVGTAVLVHGTGEAFEVEFVDYDGQTVALLTLEHTQVRPLQGGEIPHVRELASA